MKKLLVAAPAFHPGKGGVEKHLRMVFRELRRHGYEINVLVRYGDYLPAYQEVEGVRAWRMPRSASRLASIWWGVTHLPVLLGTTVVHSHDFYPRWVRKFLPRVRWIHTFHGYEGYPIDPAAIAGRQRIRAEVPVCYGVGQYIEKWYKTPLDHIIYGAVDEAPSQPKDAGSYDLVFVGRLEADTGIREYLQALQQLVSRDQARRMLIVGDGSLRGWCESFIREHDLDVEITGMVAEVMPYIPKGRVFCAGGYLSILEGAMCERPMIVYYETPIRRDAMECMPIAKDYFLADTVDQIVAAYQQAVTPEAKAHVLAAKAWARRQTWAALAEQYLQSYETGK
jgi:glycosyltransferase involved in cell wall biosynthesis